MEETSRFKTFVGNGGETHQQVPPKGPHGDPEGHLTTNQGIRISDNQNQLKVGDEGPALLEDFMYREKIFHFDHERIPERVVHARGSAVHGFFELYDSLSDITKADLFQRGGEKTPVFARFSTVAGGAGSIDTPRDVRGFAVKFYTKEGIWDLVGNNIPVFFIQDAIKFPDLVHALKMEADRGYPQAATAHDTFWDFIGLMPESMHMVMWIMSDRTIPRSFRTIEGFGVHTFRLINKEGKSTFVKFHWKPKLGLQSTVWDEAMKIAGGDHDFLRRDLFEAIDRGDFPEWELGIQAFDSEFAKSLPFDVLDSTKIIPEEILPVRKIGRMVLDRWPDNFFAETEQVAYCPGNIVPGIDFTDDPLLQGRLFSYPDTQLKRLGTTNFHQIPINAPRCPVMNFQRDGHMQMTQPKGRSNYEPNGLAAASEPTGPRECPVTGFRTEEERTHGAKLRRRPESFRDHYSQARLFYSSLDPFEQTHLVYALVFELSKCAIATIRTRMLANLLNIDKSLAVRVANGLNMDLPPPLPSAAPIIDMAPSPAVRIVNGPLHLRTLKGRTLGILFADGTDATTIRSLKKSVEEKGGRPMLIAPKIGGAILSDGSDLVADAQLAGFPSVFADAVAIVLSADGCNLLLNESAAVQFVMDAFAHLKAIGYTAESQALIDKAGVIPDEGIMTDFGERFLEAAGTRYFAREQLVRLLP